MVLCCSRLSLVAEGGSYPLAAVLMFLVAVASLATGAQALGVCASVVATCRSRVQGASHSLQHHFRGLQALECASISKNWHAELSSCGAGT